MQEEKGHRSLCRKTRDHATAGHVRKKGTPGFLTTAIFTTQKNN